jgi:hypothetical protein
MKLWIDDVRSAPEGYRWIKSVNEAKNFIEGIEEIFGNNYFLYNPSTGEKRRVDIELIDLDHDAGEYANDGDDYIRLLDWLEETGRNYPIHIHSANPVGVANMRRIIQRNGWKEIK